MPAPKGGRKQGGRRSEFDSETDLVVTRNHPVGVFAGLELTAAGDVLAHGDGVLVAERVVNSPNQLEAGVSDLETLGELEVERMG
jgi:hypothetical protein